MMLSFRVCLVAGMLGGVACADDPARESPAPTCQPQTCAELGVECGMTLDNCGHDLDCGDCEEKLIDDLVAVATALLCEELGVDGVSPGERIWLERVLSRDFRDSCLDCAHVDDVCTLTSTPGYEIVLRTDHVGLEEQPFEYHAPDRLAPTEVRFCTGVFDGVLTLAGTEMDPSLLSGLLGLNLTADELIVDARDLLAADAEQLLAGKGFARVDTAPDGTETWEVGQPQLHMVGQRVLRLPQATIGVYTFFEDYLQTIELDQRAPIRFQLKGNWVRHIPI